MNNEILKVPIRGRGGIPSPGVFNGRRMTYAQLIAIAITSNTNKEMTLRQIYRWMNE